MSTTITIKALIAALEKQKRKQPEKDVAYKFSNGKEFERKKDPYS